MAFTAAAAGEVTIGQKPTPVIIAPVTPVTFTQGDSTTVEWSMTSPVSSGSFRAFLKNTVTGSWSAITPTGANVPWNAPYSQSWTVKQPAGSYTLWIYYYTNLGTVSSTAFSNFPVWILQMPTPTITSPNSGTFVRGTSTTVNWSMNIAVSSGVFRVWLKNTLSGSWTAITPAAGVAAIPGATSYTVPWFVSQSVGTYKLWVYYYDSHGIVSSMAVSSGNIILI